MPQHATGPTAERLRHAGFSKKSPGDVEIGGNRRDGQRFKMNDNPLGRALARQIISGEEYTGLKVYALHWFAAGLAGHLNSIDLNRVLAFDPTCQGWRALRHKPTIGAPTIWRGNRSGGVRRSWQIALHAMTSV